MPSALRRSWPLHAIKNQELSYVAYSTGYILKVFLSELRQKMGTHGG